MNGTTTATIAAPGRVAHSYFWRCLRCRLLHFGKDEPRYCEHCDAAEFVLVLVGLDEERSPLATSPLVA